MLDRLAPLVHRSVLAHPRWLTDVDAWHAHIPLAFFLVHLLRPRVLVELGTHRGDSYCAFCQEVDALGLDTKCYAIDTWTGDVHTGPYGPEALEDLRSHHDPLYGSFSTLVQSTFNEALTHFSDGEIDLLHIDGEHTYDGVTRDFQAWLPKLSKRGVVLLHDTNVRTDDFGVWRLWRGLLTTYSGFELPYAHGLGVLFVGSEPEPGVAEFVKLTSEQPSEVTDFFFALGERAAARGRASRLADELERRQEEQTRLENAVRERDSQLEQFHIELNRLRQERSHREALERELDAALARASALDVELASVQRSTSWHITAPLRRGKAALRRARRLMRILPPRLRAGIRRGSGKRLSLGKQVSAPRIVSRAGRPLATRPLISVILPTWNTDPDLLVRAISSVSQQTYANWELCICDDGSSRSDTRETLRQLVTCDTRLKVVFAESNQGISAASNMALELASGEFVTFLDHDDELTPEALYEFVGFFDEQPDIDVVYSDEDKIDVRGKRSEPFCKPDWSPEYFRGVMYVGHLLMIRRSLVEAVGGFDSSFDGVQDYELMLRISERTDRIEHVALVLYHWRKTPSSLASATDAKADIAAIQARAVQAHLDRTGTPAVASPHPTLPHRAVLRPKPRSKWPSVSIVIPTKNAPTHIARCLGSIFERTNYPSFEVVVVDNGTDDADARAALERHPVKLVAYDESYDESFNFSHSNNLGVAAAEGKHVVLLNNDTEVVDAGWLQTLVWHAELPGVGAVGPLLTYPDGTVQHAGVVLGFRGTADHVMRGAPSTSDGYAGSLACTHEVSAVTGACLTTPRSVYEEAGGLNEYFATHYQDVDFCLRLRERGLRIIFTPRTRLIHYESASRGSQYDHLDRAVLLDRWQTVIARGDPYYNPNFSLEHTDYRHEPARVAAAG